jgi:hypothetical protein
MSWSPKRQSFVANSTWKAEYIARARATSHLLWMIQAMNQLRIAPYTESVYRQYSCTATD